MEVKKAGIALLSASAVALAAVAAEPSKSDSTQHVLENDGGSISLPDPAALHRLQTFRGPYRSLEAIGAPTFNPADKIYRCKGEDCIQGELLIKLAPPKPGVMSVSASSFSSLVPGIKVEPMFQESFGIKAAGAVQSVEQQHARQQLKRWYRVELEADQQDAAMQQLAELPEVERVEEIQVRTLTGQLAVSESQIQAATQTNDPSSHEQWHHERSQVAEAWQWLEDNGLPAGGNPDVVVAVIDSGVDYNHPDLKLNMWVNQGESESGYDSDGNGFTDDIHGVSVVGSQWDHHGDPMDDHGHGTHVAGIIAARANNAEGGAGVAPNVKIMAIKASQYSGILTSADIAEGIYYAVEHGADIINMSFGGQGYSQVEQDALAVAYGQAVLIASAGNNGKTNDPKCDPFRYERNYPAAYPWVVGVMAEQQYPNQYGDYLAGFSNWDCLASDSVEYELMAPGSKIFSTLPGESYGKWDGTSMAAPVVSGVAALVRTRFDDKSKYSSRFIMGQVAATGTVRQGITYDPKAMPKSYHSLNALDALTNTPKPELSYLEHYLWDDRGLSDQNRPNGKVDAGETVDLALIVRNQWGQADNVQVTLSAEVDGAMGEDPYVEWLVDSVNYDSVGTFNNDDNGLIYDAEGVVTSVESPFRFKVREDTPNNHLINFKVRFTANNGLDPQDGQLYQFESEFQLLVSRGIEMPSILSGDLPGTPGGDLDTDGVVDGVITLSDRALYIIDKPVLVEKGTTLKMGPGTEVQFWGSQPDDAYAQFKNAYLQVEGNLVVEGTVEKPVSLTPSSLFPDRMVVIRDENAESVDISHAELTNLKLSDNSKALLSHAELRRGFEGYFLYFEKKSNGEWNWLPTSTIGKASVVKSRLAGLGAIMPWDSKGDYYKTDVSFGISGYLSESLSDNSVVQNAYQIYESWIDKKGVVEQGNVFLGNMKSSQQGANYISRFVSPASSSDINYSVSQPLDFKGKQYYQVTTNGWHWTDAQRFVDDSGLDGHIATISSAEEFDAISEWMYQHSHSSECMETDSCLSSFSNVGYARQEDGSYAWLNGEQPAYDFLHGQSYWDNRSSDPEVVTIEGRRSLLKYLEGSLNDRIRGALNCWDELNASQEKCQFDAPEPVTEDWLQQRLAQFADDHAIDELNNSLGNYGFSDYASCRADGHWLCSSAENEQQWYLNKKADWEQSCRNGYQHDCQYNPVDYELWKNFWQSEYELSEKSMRVRPDRTSSAFIVEFEQEVSREVLTASLEQFIAEDFQSDSAFRNNAILNRYWDPAPDRWLQVLTQKRSGDKAFEDLSGNFWGTQSQTLIDLAVVDYSDDFNLNVAKLSPVLTEAPESAYPFVADIRLLDADHGTRPDGKFSAETMIWEVEFNRDMDTAVQPQVNFGPDYPYTDFAVQGDWVDARTWQGQVHISPVASDGYQYVRVKGAVAADDAWLVTGNDYARYRFYVDNSGLESLNLQASGGEGFVDLSWSQDDFETLYGFNLYRSTEPDSGFQRIHQSLINNDIRTFRDENVEPGQTYYYQFKVVSAAGESDPSNTASATPVDTVVPQISHMPISDSGFGANLLIQATVTDNIAVQDVTLYFRTQGQSEYQAVAMTSQQDNAYRATIPGSFVQAPSVEYYIQATDGAGYAFSGRAATPNSVFIDDAPVITLSDPVAGPATGGTTLTVMGNNFKPGATIKLGESVCELPQWVSASELTCVSGTHYPANVDLYVINPDDKQARKAGAFTYQSDAVSVGVGDYEAGYGQTLDIPVRISNVSGLKAMSMSLSYDATVLKLEAVRKGSMVASWSINEHQPLAGVVHVAAASSGSSASGDGSLLMLEFSVLTQQEATTPIEVTTLSLNDGAISADTFSGSVAILSGYSVSGGVTHWFDHSPLSHVNVLLDNGAASTLTDSNGQFMHAGIRQGAHSLSTHKADEATGITAYDASLMLQHITGASSLNGYAKLAADLNGDGAVSAMESNAVLEFAAGLSSLPLVGAPSIWEFSPAEYNYSNLESDLTGQSFTGYLMGDPSGNGAAEVATTFALSGLETLAALYNVRALDDGLLAVDLFIKQEPAAIDAVFDYDAGLLSLLRVEKSPLLGNWSLVTNTETPGRLQVASASAQPLMEDGAVLTLVFEQTGDREATLSMRSLLLNEVPVAVSSVAVSDTPSDVDADGIPDFWEIEHGLDPFSSVDAEQDADIDGLSNLEEFEAGTNPKSSDSDGDGVKDGDDALPVNPDDSRDTNGNGVGDRIDPDIDGDGVANFVDPDAYDSSQSDFRVFLKPELGGQRFAGGEGFMAALDSEGTLYLQGTLPGFDASASLRAVEHEQIWRSVHGSGQQLVLLSASGQLWRNDSELAGLQLLSDETWLKLSISDEYGVALKGDGSVSLWTLADDAMTPRLIGEGNTWADVAVSAQQILLLSQQGELYALATDASSVIYEPSLIGTDSDWVRITAAGQHYLALKADGTLWSWGDNQHGQLGHGDTSERLAPAQVGDEKHWVQITASGSNSMALASDGRLWSWGENSDGQLGHSNGAAVYSPQLVDDQCQAYRCDWVEAQLADGFALAHDVINRQWGWGTNAEGQLASDGVSVEWRPVEIGTDVNWAQDSDQDGIHDAVDAYPSDPRFSLRNDKQPEPEPTPEPEEPSSGSGGGGSTGLMFMLLLMMSAFGRYASAVRR